jgi:hypothetical protein
MFQITFTISSPKKLDFSKCRRIAVRGYTFTGLSSVVSGDVLDCGRVEHAHIVPRVVLDAVGEQKHNTGVCNSLCIIECLMLLAHFSDVSTIYHDRAVISWKIY